MSAARLVRCGVARSSQGVDAAFWRLGACHAESRRVRGVCRWVLTRRKQALQREVSWIMHELPRLGEFDICDAHRRKRKIFHEYSRRKMAMMMY